jgi:hypothetical protein
LKEIIERDNYPNSIENRLRNSDSKRNRGNEVRQRNGVTAKGTMTESRQRNEVDEREHNGIGRNTMSGGCGGRQIRRERIADIACDDLRKIEISSTRHVHVMCTGNSGTSRDTFIGMFSIFHNKTVKDEFY